jgi:hypothetical protein
MTGDETTTPRTAANPTGSDEFAVPDGAEADRCPYCGAPFKTDEKLALHVGLDHRESATDEELAAFEDAYADEREAIRLFRLEALGVLVVLYFVLLLTYAVVT